MSLRTIATTWQLHHAGVVSVVSVVGGIERR
jgi:hypothetical protein